MRIFFLCGSATRVFFKVCRFFFTRVGHPPQFGVLRPGAWPFRGIDDYSPDLRKGQQEFIHGPGLPLGKVTTFFIQNGFPYRLVRVYPIADWASGHTKKEAGNGHGGVYTPIRQNEEQHAGAVFQSMFTAATRRPFVHRLGN